MRRLLTLTVDIEGENDLHANIDLGAFETEAEIRETMLSATALLGSTIDKFMRLRSDVLAKLYQRREAASADKGT